MEIVLQSQSARLSYVYSQWIWHSWPSSADCQVFPAECSRLWIFSNIREVSKLEFAVLPRGLKQTSNMSAASWHLRIDVYGLNTSFPFVLFLFFFLRFWQSLNKSAHRTHQSMVFSLNPRRQNQLWSFGWIRERFFLFFVQPQDACRRRKCTRKTDLPPRVVMCAESGVKRTNVFWSLYRRSLHDDPRRETQHRKSARDDTSPDWSLSSSTSSQRDLSPLSLPRCANPTWIRRDERLNHKTVKPRLWCDWWNKCTPPQTTSG